VATICSVEVPTKVEIVLAPTRAKALLATVTLVTAIYNLPEDREGEAN
jgi:hypothetical protein